MDFPPKKDHIAHGSTDAVRELIIEHLWLAQVYLAHAYDCAIIEDDFGLTLALRKHSLVLKAVCESCSELADQKRAR
jgi:hypothetical protein